MFRTLKFACGVLAGTLALSAACWAQQITLSFADQNSPTSLWETRGLQPWVKKVEDATKGRVKIRIYPSQTLIKGTEMWKGIQNGIADIGWCFHGYWPELTPLSDVITLPLLPFSTAAEGSTVISKLIAKYPALQKEYDAVKLLTIMTSHQYVIVTRNKPIKTMEDFKGMKLRVTGGPPSEQIRALGGVAMLVPMPDVYQALEKGVIDGALLPWEALQSFRLYEVGRYYTIAPMSATYFSIAMNKQKWNSLPKDVQDQIMSASGPDGGVAMGTNVFDEAEAVVMGLVKEGKFTAERYVLPADEVARWRKVAGEPIWQDWVKKMEAKGKPEAKEILAATLELLKK
jgi:TRAP-type transport system periplasmic protein